MVRSRRLAFRPRYRKATARAREQVNQLDYRLRPLAVTVTRPHFGSSIYGTRSCVRRGGTVSGHYRTLETDAAVHDTAVSEDSGCGQIARALSGEKADDALSRLPA